MIKPREALRQQLVQQEFGGSLNAIRVLRTFDTAGEVPFAGASQPANQRVERAASVDTG